MHTANSREFIQADKGSVTIDVDGQVHTVANIVSINFQGSLNTQEFETLGGVVTRPGKTTITGAMEIFTSSSFMVEYFKKAQDGMALPNMTIQVIQKDPASDRGEQVVTFNEVVITDDIHLASLNISTEAKTFNFKATKMELNKKFTAPNGVI